MRGEEINVELTTIPRGERGERRYRESGKIIFFELGALSAINENYYKSPDMLNLLRDRCIQDLKIALGDLKNIRLLKNATTALVNCLGEELREEKLSSEKIRKKYDQETLELYKKIRLEYAQLTHFKNPEEQLLHKFNKDQVDKFIEIHRETNPESGELTDKISDALTRLRIDFSGEQQLDYLERLDRFLKARNDVLIGTAKKDLDLKTKKYRERSNLVVIIAVLVNQLEISVKFRVDEIFQSFKQELQSYLLLKKESHHSTSSDSSCSSSNYLSLSPEIIEDYAIDSKISNLMEKLGSKKFNPEQLLNALIDLDKEIMRIKQKPSSLSIFLKPSQHDFIKLSEIVRKTQRLIAPFCPKAQRNALFALSFHK